MVTPTFDRSRHISKRGIGLKMLVWSLSISMISFYCGIFVGLQSATSYHDTESEIERRVSALRLNGKTEYSSHPRFPKTTADFVVGAALVDKQEFIDRFDTGVARSHTSSSRNQHVYMVYQHKKALPTKFQADVITAGPLPILSVDEATQECESLNVISTKSFSGMHQCTAIVGQYESYHIHRYMRNEDNVPVDKKKYNLTRVGRGRQYSGIDDMKPPPARSQDRNFEQLSKYLKSLQNVKRNLKSILHRATGVPPTFAARDDVTRPPIIVMVCNLGQSDLLINFCCIARANGVDLSKVVVFCTDQETVEIARGLGLHAFYDKVNFQDVPSEEADTYGDEVFADVMFIKAVAVHLVSQLGYDILFTDVDVVWNQDPLPYFQTHYKDFDIMFQDDGSRSTRFAPYSGNSGFYYIRHNPRTKYLLTNVVYIGDQMRRSCSHQQALTTIMSEHAMTFGLRVKTMSQNTNFAGGYQYHRDREAMKAIVSGKVKPLVFHMCWTHNRDNKLNFMQQMGMWQVEERCQSGVKAYDVLNNKSRSDNFSESCCAKKPIIACHFSDKPSIIPCADSPKIDANGKSFW